MLDLSSFAVFAIAFLVSAVSPGPSHVAIVTRAVVLGSTGVAPFIAGIIAGDIIWLTAAIAGLSALAATFSTAFLVVKYLGVAYLVWLAWRMWTKPARKIEADLGAPPPASRSSAFFGGLSLCLGNAKVMAFYLALLPNLIDLAHVTPAAYMTLVVFVVVALGVVHGGYAVLALTARASLASPAAQRAANRIGAAALLGAAAVVATR